MTPIYKPGDLEREPYCSTPFSDLLFRNFTLQFYFRPTVEGWHEWFIVDDFGNLVRISIGGLYGNR